MQDFIFFFMRRFFLDFNFVNDISEIVIALRHIPLMAMNAFEICHQFTKSYETIFFFKCYFLLQIFDIKVISILAS